MLGTCTLVVREVEVKTQFYFVMDILGLERHLLGNKD